MYHEGMMSTSSDKNKLEIIGQIQQMCFKVGLKDFQGSSYESCSRDNDDVM